MGVPYNQLQRLRFNLSGREIGIDKYKPFTAANEKNDYSIILRGSLFQSVIESGKFSISILSGQQSSAIKEEGSIKTNFSGAFSFSPSDQSTNNIVISGKVDSALRDLNNFNSVLKSGSFNSCDGDIASSTLHYSASFSGEFREIGKYAVGNFEGNFKSQKHDTSEMDFIFFSGSYYEGHFSMNIPIDVSDKQDIDFIFFTGTYQG